MKTLIDESLSTLRGITMYTEYQYIIDDFNKLTYQITNIQVLQILPAHYAPNYFSFNIDSDYIFLCFSTSQHTYSSSTYTLPWPPIVPYHGKILAKKFVTVPYKCLVVPHVCFTYFHVEYESY